MNSGLPNDVRLARAKRENELKDILADTSSFKVHYFMRTQCNLQFYFLKNPLLLSDEFESELSKLGKSSVTEPEIAEILFGQAEHIYQEHRNYRKDFNRLTPFKRR